MSQSQLLVKRKVKEFDEWVSRAHRARRYIMDPSARAKGTSLLKCRTETGLSLIAQKYRKTVKQTRRRSRRGST